MPHTYVLLGVLYLVQGFPYGLQSGLLPVLLRTKGLSLSHIGLTRVLYLPWLLKVLWSPLIDRQWSRRTWLLLSTGGLSLCCLLCSMLPPGADFSLLAWLLLLMHVLSSLQDVVVDAVAVAALTQEQVGLGNSLQVVAYKLGSVIAGGGALTVLELLGWRQVFLLLTLGYLLGALCALSSTAILRPQQPKVHKQPSEGATLGDLAVKVFRVPGTSWAAAFVLIYKLGEQGSLSMVPLLLLDHGVSPAKLGFWNGIVSLGLSIAGSALGGALLSRGRSLLTVLRAVLSLRLLCLMLQTFLLSVLSGSSPGSTQIMGDSSTLNDLVLLTVVAQHFLAGVVTTVTFSLMMYCTQQAEHHVQAAHYSLLSSAEVLGKVFFGAVSGIVVDCLGVSVSFCLFIALSCAPLLHLHKPPLFLR
ncbi:major facilitator superfamily domain containing 3 [Xenopus tropicalis]|uniref:Major facilitator superfamily domain-containing protein 3 n=1 Tax=Xenopus tropicalis TaxID=8364 RepID=A4IIA0_XENTR